MSWKTSVVRAVVPVALFFVVGCATVHVDRHPAPLDDCPTEDNDERLGEILRDSVDGRHIDTWVETRDLGIKYVDAASYCRKSEEKLR